MTTTERRQRRHRTIQWPMTVWLTAVWMLLWGELTWANLLGGLAVALVVTVVFPLPPIVYDGRFHPAAFGWLVLRLLVDLVVSSAQVTVIAFRPRPPISNVVIEVRLRTHSDLFITLTAELVTLVPGSVVIEARRTAAVLFVHVMDADGPEQIEAARESVLAVERRVVRAFGSRAEIAALAAVS